MLHEKYILQLYSTFSQSVILLVISLRVTLTFTHWQIIYYLFTYVIFSSAITFTKTILTDNSVLTFNCLIGHLYSILNKET